VKITVGGGSPSFQVLVSLHTRCFTVLFGSNLFMPVGFG